MAVKPIPEGYHTVTPYLSVPGADKLIEFLKKAFDAKVLSEHKAPNGRIMNAEVRVGTSMLMVGDTTGTDHPVTPGSFYLYVPDCDAAYRQAVAAGATSISEPADMFYGDRHGGVKDACGNQWWIATHKEDVSEEEVARRAKALGR